MRARGFHLSGILPVVVVSAIFTSSARGQAEIDLGGWAAPIDGWDYIYSADPDQDADGEFTGAGGSLDGTWTHQNGSDAWDGSGPGDDFRPDGVTPHAPGGAGISLHPGLGEGGGDASVLTIVDIGDPRSPPFNMPDPSNRKMFFCHTVVQEVHLDPAAADGALRDGLTLIARVRMVPDQDATRPGHQLPDGGTDDDTAQGPAPGYSLRDGGKGGIGYYANGLDRMFTFTPSGLRGYQFPPQVAEGLPPQNFLDVGDNTRFQALWITIEDLDLNGLYTVTVYLNGSQAPSAVFTDIVLGDDTDCDGSSHLHMGLHSTPQKGSLEVDYFGYKVGLFEPTSDCPGGFIADLDVTSGKVTGSWSPGADAQAFRILRDGQVFLDNLPSGATSFEDPAPPRPQATYELQSLRGGAPRPGCDFPQATVRTVLCPGSLSSVPLPAKREVSLSWTAPRFLTVNGYRILRNGNQVGAAAAGDTSFTDSGVPPGEHSYELLLESTPGGACPALSASARLFSPSSPEICGEGWEDAGLSGDLQLVTTRDGVKTLYLTPGLSQDPDDTATLVLDVAALPGGVDREDFPVELLVRYENGLRISNLLDEDPPPFVAFSLSRTGISQAADSSGNQEVVAQVPNPPDPGTESISSAIVATRDVKLPLVRGRNILQLDAVNAGGVPDDGAQLFCLRIGPFAEGLEAAVVPNPCPSGLRVAREGGGAVRLSWRAGSPHAYAIRRDGTEIVRMPLGAAADFEDGFASPGYHDYELEATDDPGCPVLKVNGGGGAPDAGGFIREWLVFGPLDWRCTTGCDAPGVANLRRDFLAGTSGGKAVSQATVEPFAGMEIELGGGTATGVRTAPRTDLNPGRPGKGTWFPYHSSQPAIDLNTVFGGDPGNNYVTCAVTYLENTSGSDLVVEAHLSSDDSVELYLGETPVHANSVARPVDDPLSPGDVVPGLVLKPGMNRVLLKVFEGGGGTGFWLRFEKDLFPEVDRLRVHLTPSLAPPPPTFRRGDVDSTGTLDISDALVLLGFLFLGSERPACLEAGDVDDNGEADISDAVANLGYQFLGGPAPSSPGPLTCGPDPRPPTLSCEKPCP